MGRHLLMCRIMVQTLLEHRDDPQPKCQRLPLVQDQHTVSMAGRNLYDTVRGLLERTKSVVERTL